MLYVSIMNFYLFIYFLMFLFSFFFHLSSPSFFSPRYPSISFLLLFSMPLLHLLSSPPHTLLLVLKWAFIKVPHWVMWRREQQKSIIKVKSWFWSCHHNSIGLLGVWGAWVVVCHWKVCNFCQKNCTMKGLQFWSTKIALWRVCSFGP